jgi:hypothetical protein
MRSSDVIVEYRKRPIPVPVTRIPRDDDDPPPRPGGVPMRLRSGRSWPDQRGIYQRKGGIRSWRANG